jgi:hypothetical protein
MPATSHVSPRGLSTIVAAALVAASCAARRVEPALETPPEGRTSVRLLNVEIGASGTPDPSGERMTPAYASSDNKLPEYPAYALRAGCRDGSVPVRVYVGADGNVAAQRDVPDRPLAADQCHMAFRAAVQGAVTAWRFAPAFRQKPVAGPDRNADGRPDFTRWEQTAVMIYLDFEFSFAVVEGTGVVRAQ